MRHQVSLTGDTANLDRLIPDAARLVSAVHDHVDDAAITAAFTSAIHTTGDETTALRGLVLILAAAVPVDRPPTGLLVWLSAAREYQRLRAVGVSPLVASQLAGVAA